MQGRVSATVPRIGICAVRQQEAHYPRPAFRLLSFGLLLYAECPVKKTREYCFISTTIRGYYVQRGYEAAVCGLSIGSVIQQNAHNVVISPHAREMQGRYDFAAGIYVGTSHYQSFNAGHVVVGYRVIQF